MLVANRVRKSDIIKSIPKGFHAKRSYYINFAEHYAIDGRLLGKRLSFSYGENVFTVVFPSIIEKEGIPSLGFPDLLSTHGADIESWGKIKNYQDLNRPETIHVWLSAILVECFAKEVNSTVAPLLVQKLAKKVVYTLQLTNPDGIRKEIEDIENDICEVKYSVSYSEEEKPQIEGRILVVLDDGKGLITLDDIHRALKSVNNTVSAPYEMVGNARMNLLRQDYRAVVLNCATSLEVMLKRKVADYLEENHISRELRDYVLKRIDGYAKLVEISLELKIPLSGLPNVKETVFRIRNRVIHGGYKPSYEEANKAYSDTREALRVMSVPMFE